MESWKAENTWLHALSILNRYDVEEDSWTVLGNLPIGGQTDALMLSKSEAIVMMHPSNKIALFDLETQTLKSDFDHIPSWQNTVHGRKATYSDT